MIQFFAPDIEETLTLPDGESQHCIKVLRKQPGDFIEVIDGKSHRFSCMLVDANPKRAKVEIIEKCTILPYWASRIVIGVAPTKHLDRMEWLTEKLTEIGVDTITPLLCRYSERKDIKAVRLEKIAISAMKQSLKATCPKVDAMTSFKSFIAATGSFQQKFIAYCDDSVERHLLTKEYSPGKDTVIAIGPEGDFSPEEVTMATKAGFIPVSLGQARLRTETAALTACMTFHILNQLQSEQT